MADSVGASTGPADQAPTGVVLANSWWLGFTGLIPVALAVPILIARLYAVGIVVGLVMGVTVLTYHLRRGQGVTTLDVGNLCFGTVTAVLYFGFSNAWTIKNLGLVIYCLLTAQTVHSLARRRPWTAQFARRMVHPDLWDTPEFVSVNMWTTALWAACFGICAGVSLALAEPVRFLVPAGLLLVAGVATRPLAEWRVARLGVPEPVSLRQGPEPKA